MKTKEKQVRATFQDTLRYQLQLREIFDILDKENRPIHDEERENYFEKLARALLGHDFEKEHVLIIKKTDVLIIKNLGGLLRQLAYEDGEKIDRKTLEIHGKFESIKNSYYDFSDIWHGLKFIIYGIFPEAILTSVKISKEQTHLGVSDSGKV